MNFQILFFKWSGTTLLGGLFLLDLLDNLDLVKLLLDLLVAVLLGQLGQIDDLSLGEALLVLALVSGTDSADDSLDLLLRQGLVLARGPGDQLGLVVETVGDLEQGPLGWGEVGLAELVEAGQHGL